MVPELQWSMSVIYRLTDMKTPTHRDRSAFSLQVVVQRMQESRSADSDHWRSR